MAGTSDNRAAQDRATTRRVPVVFGAFVLLVVVVLVALHPGHGSKRAVVRSIPVSISCPVAGTCVVVDDEGNAVRYHEQVWSKPVSLEAAPLNSVSCSSIDFCVAVGVTGQAEVYQAGSWGRPHRVDARSANQRATDSGPTGLGVVACASSSLCMSGDALGHALEFNGQSWDAPSLIAPPHVAHREQAYGTADIGAMACATAVSCVASTVAGQMSIFNGRSWSQSSNLEPVPSTAAAGKAVPLVAAISCPSPNFCVAVDPFGDAFTYDGATWSAPDKLDPLSSAFGSGLGLTSVSCPTRSFCMAVDDLGAAFRYDGSSWSKATKVESSLGLSKVSCASPSFCVALDELGDAFHYSGTAWSAMKAIES
jgi:hypothetical protein